MDSGCDDLLRRAHDEKVLGAASVLERLRRNLRELGSDHLESSRALRGEATQAVRRSEELLAESVRLAEAAERLVAEAGAIRAELS